MSRSITQTSSSSSAVAAGSSVIVPVNTTTGFSAGDYVYTLPSGGVGTRATGNVGVGLDTPYVGTSFINTSIQTAGFRATSYGPLVDQAVYSGTTRAIGTVTAGPTTTLATAIDNTRSCTLANGNIVEMYSQGANLYFRIIDTTGTVVVAQTTLTTSLYTSTNVGHFACCTLTSGNIQFIFNVGTTSYCNTAQYSPTGSVVVASTSIYVGPSQFGNLSMAALSGGGSVVLGSSGYTANVQTNAYFLILSSSGAYQTNGTVSSSTSGEAPYGQVIGLPASYGTNIWAYYAQDVVTAAGYYAYMNIYTNGTRITSVQNTYSTLNNAGGGVFNSTFSTDGFIYAITWFGGLYYSKWLYTKTSDTTGTLSVVANGSIGSGDAGTLSATANGGLNCISSATGQLYVNTSSNGTTWTSQVSIGSNTGFATSFNKGRWSSSTSTGLAVINYRAVTTSYATSVSVATIAATNGSTALTGSSYTPSQGYYLMGVAATDAAANSTGQVIVNGTAQLGSAYPTVTIPIYYSYQTTASQPIFGQRGVVNATTVTLKGLEA